jgi:hypothetical protein
MKLKGFGGVEMKRGNKKDKLSTKHKETEIPYQPALLFIGVHAEVVDL